MSETSEHFSPLQIPNRYLSGYLFDYDNSKLSACLFFVDTKHVNKKDKNKCLKRKIKKFTSTECTLLRKEVNEENLHKEVFSYCLVDRKEKYRNILRDFIWSFIHDARKLLGTHKDSSSALQFDVDEKKGFWNKIRLTVFTIPQLKCVRNLFDVTFVEKNKIYTCEFSHFDDCSSWNLTHTISNISISFNLVIQPSARKFLNIHVVQFTIGKFIVQKYIGDVKEHFEFDKVTPLTMLGQEALSFLFDFTEVVLQRKLNSYEEIEYERVICTFWLNNNTEDKFSFVISCSIYGIMVIVGKTSEEAYVPFCTIAGFGSISSSLQKSRRNPRTFIHFCS